MAITKTVSFQGPYIGKTFQDLAKSVVGRDGYLGGAAASDDGTNITLQPYSFLQAGIVCSQDAVSTLPAPSGPQPWFVIVSVIDDDPSTGVLLQATNNVSQLGAAVVVAYKLNGRWRNPVPITVAGVRDADRQSKGRDAGFQTAATVSGGVVTAFEVGRGRAVDAAGERRDFGGTQFAPLRPGFDWGRNDHLILRKREAGSEVILALGNANGGLVDGAFTSVDAGALVSRPSLCAKRGGGFVAVAYAWGNGNALRLVTALEASATSLVGVQPVAVYTGGATIANVWIAGQRTADGAIVVVFTEGNNVKVAAFSAVDASTINPPLRIDTQPNACLRLRAKLDLDGYLHVVYQHNEGGAPPNQQIYYVKCSVASSSFGAPAITPRLVNGVNSTNNDTWPSVDVDRRRQVHIAYTTGTAANDFGQLRYVALDQNGSVLTRATYATYGHEPDPTDLTGIVDGSSLIDNVQRPQVIVTPHDEVNIFLISKRLGYASADQVALFNPAFLSRLGFSIIVLSGLFPASAAGTDALISLGATCDELGQLLVMANWSAAGLLYARLDTILAPFGVLQDSYLEQPSAPLVQMGNGGPELILASGPAGDLLFGVLDGTNASIGLAGAKTSGLPNTPHPNDVYLGGSEIDAGAKVGTTLDLPEQSYQTFRVRPKRMSYPVIVGDDGDYQGYASLTDALTVANRTGGHVVARGGNHRLVAPLVLRSGVRLEGEGHVTLELAQAAPAGGWIQLGTMPAPLTCSVSNVIGLGSVVTLAGAPPLRSNIRAGDLCEFLDPGGTSAGLFRVRRILDDTRFAVDGTPNGVEVVIYACGVELQNVSVISQGIDQAAPLVMATALYGGLIERVKLAGSMASAIAALRMSYCRESAARAVDVLSVSSGSESYGIQMDFGSDNLIERALLGDESGTYLKLEATTQNPRVLNCGSAGADQARYQIDGPRTGPVFMAACAGRVDGDVANVVTHVGKVITAVSGRSSPAGALQFQDENTLLYQAGAPLDLTAPSASGAQFNGATPRIIVPSVNERLLRAGDAMTGELGVVDLALGEIAAPALPLAGSVKLYLRSNGQAAGQTPPAHRSELVMLDPDGNALVIAQTELS